MFWKELKLTNPVSEHHDQTCINGGEKEKELGASEEVELKLL